ncbi:MAG: SUMF1/EgtB/PvdO family nonheme iron enzyme [Spirochaetaceae bacterium]|nr:SUMF1/EgtB/PvdO family nonheme iron enzyme [Spirochaetaceae bacterium]
MVQQLVNGKGVSPDDARVVTNFIRSRIGASGAVTLVTREDFDAILAEHEFQMSDWSDPNKTAQLGAAAGADYILVGEIDEMDEVYFVTARMIDLNTAVQKASSDIEFKRLNQARGAMEEFTDRFLRALGYTSASQPAGGSLSPVQPGSQPAGGNLSPLQEAIRTIDGNMASVPGGTFLMGSAAGQGNANERPQRQVSLGGFSIGKYEVTQGEYEAVMGSNPSSFKGGSTLPVETVSWLDAVEFCNRLSRAANLTPAYTISGANVMWNRSANGYRLPTEAEWEYACGEWIDGWVGGNSGRVIHPVGQLAANRYGLHDMIGNVQEWCWDWYGNYGRDVQPNPRGPESGTTRVRRGHSFQTAGRLLLTNRDYGVPRDKNTSTGFRIARSGS